MSFHPSEECSTVPCLFLLDGRTQIDLSRSTTVSQRRFDQWTLDDYCLGTNDTLGVMKKVRHYPTIWGRLDSPGGITGLRFSPIDGLQSRQDIIEHFINTASNTFVDIIISQTHSQLFNITEAVITKVLKLPLGSTYMVNLQPDMSEYDYVSEFKEYFNKHATMHDRWSINKGPTKLRTWK